MFYYRTVDMRADIKERDVTGDAALTGTEYPEHYLYGMVTFYRGIFCIKRSDYLA